MIGGNTQIEILILAAGASEDWVSQNNLSSLKEQH
jgi:hypothetical protein